MTVLYSSTTLTVRQDLESLSPPSVIPLSQTWLLLRFQSPAYNRLYYFLYLINNINFQPDPIIRQSVVKNFGFMLKNKVFFWTIQ